MDSTAGLLHLLETDGRRLHRLLTRLTLRADAADDLLQDLFLRLRSSAGFGKATDPAAFAVRTAVNLAFDWRRQRRRRREVGEVPDHAIRSDPLAKLMEREELNRVLTALTELSESVRTCLVLRYLEQMDADEVGRLLGKTAHQVRALCAKGLVRLRRRLGEEVSRE